MAELQPPPEGQVNGGAPPLPSSDAVATKRQRRPSVRLGDIGDQPSTLSYDSLARRTKHWHDYKHKKEAAAASGKGSKTRNLLNLGGGGELQETLEGEDKEGICDGVAIGSWKVRDPKSRRGFAKRMRSNWASVVDEGGGEGADNGYRDRDFEPEGSDSLLKEQSPIHSLDNMAVDPRRPYRTRVSEGKEPGGVELEGPSDTDARDWRCGTSADMHENGGRARCPSADDGVRIWLDGLGLGRYAAVFEIHEVDDEVLPMLTLEDLKDMGINAVGSRRKMFCAIQKLGKGFS